MTTPKGLPLTKEEVALLIDLVNANKIITSKATNATNNQLKEVAWSKVTDSFNASISSCPRRVEQLKLKWENLKKAARKRSASIRLNRIKTGGGKPDYIAPDDALEKVASILGATCDGYSVPFGGDAEVNIMHESVIDDGVIEIIDGAEVDGLDGEGGSTDILISDELGSTPNEQTQIKTFFSTPNRSNSITKRKRKLEEDDVKARIARNQSITDYYNEKRKKLQIESENLQIINQKLKLELEQLDK